MNFSTSKNRSPSVGRKKYNHPARFNTYYRTLEDDGRAFYTADMLQQQQQQAIKTPAKLPIEWSHENALNTAFSNDPVVWRTPSMTAPTAESDNGSPDINQYLNDLKEKNGDLGIYPKRKFHEDGIHRLMYKLKKGKDEIEGQVKQMSRIELSLMEGRLNLSQKDVGQSLLQKDRMNKAKKMFGFGFGLGLGGKELLQIPKSRGGGQKMMAKGVHPTLNHTKHSASTIDESRTTRLPSSLSFHVDPNKRVSTVESDNDNIFGMQNRTFEAAENTTIDTETFSMVNGNMMNKTLKEGYYSNYSPEKNGYLFSQDSKRTSLMTSGLMGSRLLRKGTKSVDDKKRPIVIHSKEGLERQKLISGKNVISQPATSNRAKYFGNLKDWFDSSKINGKSKESSSRRGYDLLPIPNMKTKVNNTGTTLEDEEESCLSVARSSVFVNEGEKSDLMRKLDQVKKKEIKPLNMATPQLTITWDVQESASPQQQLKRDVVIQRGGKEKLKSKNEKMIDLDFQIKKKMISNKLEVKQPKKQNSPLKSSHSIVETDIDGWSMSNGLDLNRRESLFKDDLD